MCHLSSTTHFIMSCVENGGDAANIIKVESVGDALNIIEEELEESR